MRCVLCIIVPGLVLVNIRPVFPFFSLSVIPPMALVVVPATVTLVWADLAKSTTLMLGRADSRAFMFVLLLPIRPNMFVGMFVLLSILVKITDDSGVTLDGPSMMAPLVSSVGTIPSAIRPTG